MAFSFSRMIWLIADPDGGYRTWVYGTDGG